MPAKSKKSEDMIDAFENIFTLSKGILPHKLYTDRGLEFEAKNMHAYFHSKDIDKRVVYSPDVHASMAERANRTIKERLYRVNRVTGLKPNSVTFNNAKQLYDRLYKGPKNEIPQKVSSILKTGQTVRITKEKGKFEKGYLPNYTDELFRIYIVNDSRNPITYKIKDLEGNIIEGVFYREELVPTEEDTTHRIAEILKTRTTRDGIKQHFVRWVGYKDSHNSWIKDSDIVRR
uniref:Chromo domain-containing protein n=1 Tax=Meloidogyne hapla TaxID=6305 RepID=A0A1I8B912_MELHA